MSPSGTLKVIRLTDGENLCAEMYKQVQVCFSPALFVGGCSDRRVKRTKCCFSLLHHPVICFSYKMCFPWQFVFYLKFMSGKRIIYFWIVFLSPAIQTLELVSNHVGRITKLAAGTK